MDRIKSAAVSTKNFVSKHRVGLAWFAGVAVGLTVNYHNIKQTNEFLKEHDLYDLYWYIDAE